MLSTVSGRSVEESSCSCSQRPREGSIGGELVMYFARDSDNLNERIYLKNAKLLEMYNERHNLKINTWQMLMLILRADA